MRRAGICFWMMIKRMGRRPIYWGLLLLFPAALFAVPAFNRGGGKGADCRGICDGKFGADGERRQVRFGASGK